MSTYTVKAERSDGWWALTFYRNGEQIRGAHSQARRWDEIRDYAPEVWEWFIEDDEVEHYEVELVGDVADAVAHVNELNRWISAATAERDELRPKAIRMLLEHGVSQRDIGAILGISQQRVAQLTKR